MTTWADLDAANKADGHYAKNAELKAKRAEVDAAWKRYYDAYDAMEAEQLTHGFLIGCLLEAETINAEYEQLYDDLMGCGCTVDDPCETHKAIYQDAELEY